uniref:Putative ovule protein n=2 Tax=Solanum chacoense TaxID=4108 RepID=A0A0V0GWX6_SOLCH
MGPNLFSCPKSKNDPTPAGPAANFLGPLAPFSFSFVLIYTKCIFDVYNMYTTNSRTLGPLILFELQIFTFLNLYFRVFTCISYFPTVYQRIQQIYQPVFDSFGA